jgi:hypothetical protein
MLLKQITKENKMKKLLALLAIALASTAFAGGEVKKVCNTDPKTKKEVCKDVKVHKKVEGEKVPESAKKK